MDLKVLRMIQKNISNKDLGVGLNSSDSTGCKVMEGGGRNYPQNVGHISLFPLIVLEDYASYLL